MSEPDTISRSNACYECHAGIMQPRHLTYFTWLGEELITVPHFPAWICDVCGKRECDEKAIQWLNMLLDPNAGKPTTNRHLQCGHCYEDTEEEKHARHIDTAEDGGHHQVATVIATAPNRSASWFVLIVRLALPAPAVG